MGIWNAIVDAFASALGAIQGALFPLFGVNAWGWAIIALTVIVRILLLPLAIKQIRSMRAMQAIQPKMKEIQKKHKVDRELMRKDPEKYRAKKQKLNEEMMALYQQEGVNPAASCLPLIAQAPVFIALFWVLRDRVPELINAPFYFVTNFISAESEAQGLGALVSSAGWPGWLLIVFMALTLFISQKQMMARQAASGQDNPMAQQQKILLYVLPVFLGVISFNLPLGVLLYWVTTNLWQAGQQAIMLREVKSEAEDGTLADRPGGEAARRFSRKGKRKPDASGPDASGPAGTGRGSATSGKGGGSSATSGKGGGSATSGKGRPEADASSDDGTTAHPNGAEPDRGSNGRASDPGSKGGGASSGKGGGSSAAATGASSNGNGASSNGDQPASTPPVKRDHLPRRPGKR